MHQIGGDVGIAIGMYYVCRIKRQFISDPWVATMSQTQFFGEKSASFNGLFNRKHFGFRHDLVGHPLFQLDRLAELSKTILTASDGKWSVNHNVLYKPAETVPNSAKQWDNFKPADIVPEAIRNIRESAAWVLITGADLDPDYRELLNQMLADGERSCGTEYRDDIIWSTLSILVGSPNSVTHYHVDSESNFLFQIHGHKEAHLFDADDRRVTDERLHVLSALLLVVLAVDGMIERDELDGVAVDAALFVDLVDCQLRTLEGGLAVGSRAARKGQRDAELEFALRGEAGPRAATGSGASGGASS